MYNPSPNVDQTAARDENGSVTASGLHFKSQSDCPNERRHCGVHTICLLSTILESSALLPRNYFATSKTGKSTHHANARSRTD
jgi:hypothetical protein